ncbi:SusC/RagA family TonB-linked outer membrane protein [Bacteroides sp.]
MRNNVKSLVSRNHLSLSCCLRLFLLVFLSVNSGVLALAESNQRQQVSGVVRDQFGEPLPGVNILVVGTTVGTITDIDGAYSIAVSSNNAVLRFSLIGFASEDVAVKGRTTVNLTMTEETQLVDEVVVVGYGTQKKVSLTGAISSVKNDEIIATPSVNVQNMLSGKLPGLRIQQNTGEPGNYDASMDIRGLGSPLVVIDGVVRETSDLQRLEANDIESVTVLKDASAAIYGMRASNGVLLVTTRKGAGSGKAKIDYTGSFGFQNPTGLPEVLNPGQYAELVREADKNMGRGIDYTFSAEDLARYQSGDFQATDWSSLVLNKMVPQTHHNVTASGNTDRVNYYLSFGYYGEEGLWKSGDLNYHRFNIRSNLGFKITDNLKAEMLISGVSDEKNQPYRDTWELFKSIWALRPNETPYANDNENYYANVMSKSGLNPLVITDADKTGYKRYQNKTLNTTFSLTYDAPFLKGLSARFLYSYDYKTSQEKQFQKAYTLYSYEVEKDDYIPGVFMAPSSVRRKSWEASQNLLQASLSYEQVFNKKHNVKALFLYEQTAKEEDNVWAKRILEMDAVDQLFSGSENEQEGSADGGQIYRRTNMGLVGRVNYDYDSKYLLEASFRYDGSSKFAKGHRWGFFPSVSAGYRISEENFIKDTDALSFLTNWKVRASYGVLGDDGSSSYQYLSGYDYPGVGYVYGTEAYKGLGFRGLPNPNITWYKSKTLNIGTDMDILDGLFSFQLDFFWRYRDGLLGRRNQEVPGTIGAEMPEENMNKDLYKGFEIVLGHRNQIRDFRYSVSLNFALTRKKNRAIVEGDAVNSYDKWRGKYSDRYTDMGWGYGSNGQFTSMEDIWNSPDQDGKGGSSLLPGDWKYEDWNGDGIIDDNDVYPNVFEFGNSNPKMTYGATITASWKGFDLNILFQGGAGFNVRYLEQLQYPLCFGGNGLSHFYDRYHQDEDGNWIAGKWPTTRDPAACQSNLMNSQQTTYDASYLRLKSVELGYTIPVKFTRKFKVERCRIFANGYNLFTITGLDFVDPERTSGAYGYLYPIMRNFNFGLNLSF